MLRFSLPDWLLLGLGGVLALWLVPPSAAQERPSIPDSIQQTARNSSSPGASSRPGANADSSSKGVQFTASDSLVIRTPPDSADRGTLYGQAQMNYQGATLKAATIEMNFETSSLRASGAPSDTASPARPSFQRGQGQSFTGKTLSYNLRTRRGRVVAARTQQKQGYVQGDAVKVFEDSTLFVQGGSYTTCDCPPGKTPSYSLRSNRMKVDGKWVYTGPIHLYLFNIPTPLWLPFGFLPNVPGRRSGPLSPDYGQDREKGIFLRNWGWYFALNAYTDLQLKASVWSKGSFEVNPIFRYRKRYNYNGRLDVTYRRTQVGEEEDPDFTNRHRGQLRWSHSQDLSPTASIRGNINLATSTDFARRNSNNYNDAVSREISSSLRYSKNWPGGGKNLSVSANQRQQLQSGEVSMTLPTLNFSQRSFKPFEVEQAVGDDRWYEKITTSYDFSLDNNYSFRPRDPQQIRSRGDSTLADSLERAGIGDIAWYEALVDRRKYELATGKENPFDFKASHQIPLSASFRVNRYNLSLSPNIRYNSDWFISTTRRFVARDTTFAPDGSIEEIEEEDVERTVQGFYARREFSTGISANTELFGLFPLRVGPLQGLRHRVSPSLSFNFSPNFNAPFWGQTRPLRFDNGDPVIDDRTGKPIRYDIRGGGQVRGSNEQRRLSFNLDNELETKYATADTTGETKTKKIKLLDFDLDTSYNFTADSLKLSDIGLRARTTIQDFSIRSNMTFSPYALEPTGESNGDRFRLADRYMAAENPLTPIRLTRFQLNVSSSFDGGAQRGSSSQGGQRSRGGRSRGGRGRSSPSAGPSQASAPSPSKTTGYLDASIPWSLNFDFSYSFRKPRKSIRNQNATLNTRFSLNVTPRWYLEGRTGYDFVQDEVATTSININRDIGSCRCWVMSFSWVPFGARQSYSFNLQVKSGQLSQLLRLQIPSAGQGGPLGGFGNRLRSTVGSAAGGIGGGGGRGRGGPSF
ncbi:MAG: putative LPS assembly protein LptD [Salinibacter sp.]